MTASGSSALAWSTGAPTVLATSVGCRLDLASHGAVVNPTWLLITMCTVPFVVNPAPHKYSQPLRFAVNELRIVFQ